MHSDLEAVDHHSLRVSDFGQKNDVLVIVNVDDNERSQILDEDNFGMES